VQINDDDDDDDDDDEINRVEYSFVEFCDRSSFCHPSGSYATECKQIK